MSTEVTNLAWYVDSLPNATKMVLLRLADHANERYECWPSQMNLARRCGMSTRSVVRHIQKLIDCGFITKTAQFNNNNRYTMNIDALESEALPVIEREREERKAAKVGKCQPVTCEDDHKCQDGVTYVSDTGDTLITNESPDLNNPIVPSKGQEEKVRLTNTNNPHHKDYKLKSHEKDILVNEWNKIATGKFKLRKVFDSSCERALAKTYSAYKQNHREGHHDGELKTKLQFATTLLEAFPRWVAIQDNPLFFMRHQQGKTNSWVATLDYALRASTYEKIINE